MRIHSLRLLPIIALAACLVSPGIAQAKLPDTKNTKIKPGKGMAGIKLDMTRAKVFDKWGKGKCVSEGEFCIWQRKKPSFSGEVETVTVSFYGSSRKVWQIALAAAYTKQEGKLVPGALTKWKTSKNIHLGSKGTDVPAAYPAAEPHGGESGGYSLFQGSGQTARITDFNERGFGASATRLGSIVVRWEACHYLPDTPCPS